MDEAERFTGNRDKNSSTHTATGPMNTPPTDHPAPWWKNPRTPGAKALRPRCTRGAVGSRASLHAEHPPVHSVGDARKHSRARLPAAREGAN
jgi:hypothetical protein